MTITIKAQKRVDLGKNACRRLRSSGRIPAVIYGESTDSLPLAVDKKDLLAILKSESGENTLFKVGFDAEILDAMIKDLQTDPVTDELLHVDLIRISMDKILRVSVPVLLKGEPVGVKAEGGFVDFVTRQLDIECLPKNIPESLELDISDLHLHQAVKASDVLPPEGVKVISDPGTVLALIALPKEEVAKKAEGEEEAVEGEAEAEPEVIKKERAEKEKEEPEKKKE
ncbi:MAG: 50S ribosomal protein L25 [Candidatus Aminicenantes bacterium]|nr:50S ribosomal protein L25 [Candidatus Aminicenantes bacterium]